MSGSSSNHTKKTFVRGLGAAALAALIGLFSTGISAAGPSQFWSVAVHIRYTDGTVYEHAFATGVTTDLLPSILAECARAHMYGSGVQYHCFAIPE